MNRKTYTFTIQMQLNKWTRTQKQDDGDINDARRRFRIYILKNWLNLDEMRQKDGRSGKNNHR